MEDLVKNLNEIDSQYNGDKPINEKFIGDMLMLPTERSYIFDHLIRDYKPDWFELLYNLRAFNFEFLPKAISSINDDGKEIYGFNNWQGCFIIWEAAKHNLDGRFTQIILKLINDYINYVNNYNSTEPRNFTADYYFCQYIFLLPLNKIIEKHLTFITKIGLGFDRSLISADLTEKFFPRLLAERKTKLIYFFLNLFYRPNDFRNEFNLTSNIDDFYLESFSRKVAPDLYSNLGKKVIDWAIETLAELSSGNTYYFMKMNIVSIERDSESTFSSGINIALIDLNAQLLNQEKPAQLKNRLPALLAAQQTILNRLGYYLVNLHYKQLNSIFWESKNPLNNSEAKSEISKILIRNCRVFTEKQITILINWIETLKVEFYGKETKKQKEKYLAYVKLEWYQFVKDIQFKFKNKLNQRITKLQEISERIVPETLNDGSIKFKSVSPSPSITTLSLKDTLNILSKKELWGEYNIWSLQNDVREFVIQKPSEILENIDLFLQLPLPFFNNFIDGIRTVVQQNKIVPVPEVYDFILKYLAKNKNVFEVTDSKPDSNAHALGTIAWLIRTICDSKDIQLNSDELKQSVSILIFLEENYKAPFVWLNNDAAMDITNSIRGKIYESMISCALREKRDYKETGFVWNNHVKMKFGHWLNDHSLKTEFYWTLGFYTPQISFLDMPWLKTNSQPIFIVNDKIKGNAAFKGYLLFSKRLYTDLYELLQFKYKEGINTITQESGATRMYVEHILLSFLTKPIGSDQLIDLILENHQSEQLRYLVNAIYPNSHLLNDEKLTYLWSRLLENLKEEMDVKLRTALTSSANLIEHFQELNESAVKLFVKAISFGNTQTRSFNLLKIIQQVVLKGKYEEGYKMLLSLLSNKSMNFSYDFGLVDEIIKTLYQNLNKGKVNELAIASLVRTNWITLKTFNENNPKPAELK